MGRSKKVEEVVEEVVEVQNGDNITFHTDRDPNDERFRPQAETGFSLDDEE